MPNQPRGFDFSIVNIKKIIIIGTCYLVYELPGHLIPFTGCCACINCDLCRLTSIKKTMQQLLLVLTFNKEQGMFCRISLSQIASINNIVSLNK